MPSQRIRRRVEKCGPTVRAALAVADVAAEGVTRTVRRAIELHRAEARSAGAAGEPPPAAVPPPPPRLPRSITLDQAIAAVGHKILERCRRMVAADAAYDRERMLQRARCRRRDLLARRLYDYLKLLRRPFRKSKREVWHHLGLKGPTSRDPAVLALQGFRALHFLTHPRRKPATGLPPAFRFDPAMLAIELLPLCTELDDAIWDVECGRVALVDALAAQRRAIGAFDEIYNKGSRFVESTLDFAGLPTLRDLVRPGVGRRGRPPKVKLVDDHPDLVERALSRTVLDLEEVERLAGGSREDDSAVRKVARSCSDDHFDVENGADRDTSGEEKSDQPLHKLAEGGEKSDQDLRNVPKRDEKSDQGLRQLEEGEEKSDQGLHKLQGSAVSPLIASLKLSPLVRECGRGRWGSDTGVFRQRNRGRPAMAASDGPRDPGRPDPANSPLGRVREAASGWWQRLRRAA